MPTLEHDINSAFDRIVAALRDAGVGEGVVQALEAVRAS
jgi:hypothetical protein